MFVGERHKKHIEALLRMEFPRDRTKFEKLLGKLEVDLLFENQWHLDSLKRGLPRLVRDYYSKPRKVSNG